MTKETNKERHHVDGEWLEYSSPTKIMSQIQKTNMLIKEQFIDQEDISEEVKDEQFNNFLKHSFIDVRPMESIVENFSNKVSVYQCNMPIETSLWMLLATNLMICTQNLNKGSLNLINEFVDHLGLFDESNDEEKACIDIAKKSRQNREADKKLADIKMQKLIKVLDELQDILC